MIKYKSSINWHSNLAQGHIAPTLILQLAAAQLEPMENTIQDAMFKKQFAVSAQNKQLLPRWSKTDADKLKKFMS